MCGWEGKQNAQASELCLHLSIFLGLTTWAFSSGVVASEEVPRGEHPRPDFRREAWINLNGTWQFRFDPENRGLGQKWYDATAEFNTGEFNRRIVVPFCWQSKLSRISDIPISDVTAQKIGWYRRMIEVPESFAGQRVWLRFGAVDWEARVWVNGREVGRHEGGYTPFEFDVTEQVRPGAEAAIVVRVLDATDRELPLGKQAPGWYTPTSGIWQTVWLEARPAQYVAGLRLTPNYRHRQWSLEVEVEAAGPDGRVHLRGVARQVDLTLGRLAQFHSKSQ